MPGTNLILSKSRPLPSVETKLSSGGSTEKPCTLFDAFKPKRGGQTDFFNLVPLDSIENTPYRAIWLKGGLGSGKSHLGAAFACSRAFLDPASRGLITANTYSQLETATLPALIEFCDQFNIPIEPRRATTEETAKAIAARRLVKIFDASILVLSAEAFMGQTVNSTESGRGLENRWLWGDELSYSAKSAFDTLNGRLGRGKGKIKGLALITSSINRNDPYNFLWDIFIDPDRSDDLKRLYTSVNLLTSDNDTLDADYVTSLEASFTKELAAIELKGEFAVTTEGVVFSYFDRAQHVKSLSHDKLYPLHLSFDFNRHPATATVSQNIGEVIYVLKEFYLLDSDTFKLAIEVRQYISAMNPFYFELHGDSTGSNRSANSTQSNWDIVGNEFHGLNFARCYGKTNPPVLDTINSVNCLLKQNRIEVDVSCKELIKDLEQVKFDRTGGLDKKSDLMRTHLCDSLRYLAHDLYPYESMRAYGAIVGGGFKMPQFNGVSPSLARRGQVSAQTFRELNQPMS